MHDAAEIVLRLGMSRSRSRSRRGAGETVVSFTDGLLSRSVVGVGVEVAIS